MHLKLLSTVGLSYAVLLVYASLMPFDFSFDAEKFTTYLGSFLNHWPLNPDARISGSDIVSNLALYVPLGWIIAVRLRLDNRGMLLSMITSGMVCSIISLGVELSQTFIVSRISSASDLCLNTISGGVGSAMGVLYGKALWISGIRWLRQSWESRPVIIAVLIFAGLLMADAFSPYLPTLLLKQVWQSFGDSHFDVVQGFLIHPWHWWLVQRFFVYLFLTLLFAGCIKHKNEFKTFLYAAFFVALFSLFLEMGKWFIVSRSFNIANPMTSWAGCLAAVLTGWAFEERMSVRKKMDIAICFLFLYLFYLAWFPFDFAWNQDRIQNVFSSPIKLLPLYDYAMGATLNHARLFMQSLFLLGILVYVLRVRYRWFENPKTGIWFAAIFCATLGLLQEGGQLFLSSRTPSATDIYCFALGGSMGAWIKRP
ncbi:putative VanZ-like membrane protein [Desulforapulum autotrophicum HRM2]|uniref:VanZ-like membrane protein n=1 Tax=Desulforapulum autotrophicum (strain ATCC 43914 / DSM 3382 / VKM B-1955 / HRM2) TaxID=177437 RepID=C0QCN1_DESAH|nr:VanZ family protein [Desulforapulum autotrophicum]ACN15108.1 putative VanZ-like membrane protein [Desulforapulum autotrophicum HRM2]